MSDQLGLFGGARSSTLGPAPVSEEDRALAEALPSWLRLGTSSWSFQGWQGLVYDRKAHPDVLSREGLRAYSANPLFRTVGVDRSHYKPLTVPQWHHYAEQVPQDFRFLVKAHEFCTLHRFPSHARYGKRRETDDEDFLNPRYATEEVVGPTVEGLGSKLGVLLFQFAAQDLRPIGGPDVFCDRLYSFLSQLPRGPTYAVEVRNQRLLIPRLAEALEAAGAMPCLNAIPRMPAPAIQWERSPAAIAPVLVMRWMLHAGMDYASAQRAFAPFDRLVQEAPDLRAELVELAKRAPRDTYLIINNKAEGSSPLSVRRFAHAFSRTP